MKIIKNADIIARTWCGQEIQPSASYEITVEEDTRWASSSAVLAALADGTAIMNNGTADITDLNEAINFLKGDVPKIVQVASMPPFASKKWGTNSLYKRVVGIKAEVQNGDNEITWTCPFAWVKFMAIEIANGDQGDTIDLFILDTATGTYTTVPNFVMNQFGFKVNIPNEFYKHSSEFDADIFQGLQIKIVYNVDEATITPKTVGINFVMNEVKVTT